MAFFSSGESRYIDFAYFRHKGFVKIDFMIIGSGRGDMVGCFLKEDLSEVSIFQLERDLEFCLFSGNGKLHCCSKLGNVGGV